MSEQLPDTVRPDTPDDDAGRNAADDASAKSPEVEFALVLSRMIDDVASDPVQLRNAVYELARIKLRADTAKGEFAERRRLIKAFDTAVSGVETFYQRQHNARPEPQLPGPSQQLIAAPASEPPEIEDEKRAFLTDYAVTAIKAETPATVFLEPRPRWSARHRLAIGALVLLTVGGLAWRFGGQALTTMRVAPTPAVVNAPEVAAAPAAEPAPPPALAAPARIEPPATPARVEQPAQRPDLVAPGIPMPVAYGVYAVSGGQLTELNPLPGRVPDQRVFMSTAINQPSQATVPDGRIQFVIFRRDLGGSIPDRMAVRVIAKVKTDVSFDGKGQPVSAAAEESWTVRSNAFDFRVLPVQGQPDMLTLKPDKDNLQLSAGRYGLILKGQAYDFTVAGDITDPAQCLERMAAVNGTFYAECGAAKGR